MEKNGKRSLVTIVKYEIILWALWLLRSIPGQLGCYVRRPFLTLEKSQYMGKCNH